MSVQTTIESYLNYITGSAGGWPANTNTAIFSAVLMSHTCKSAVMPMEVNTRNKIIATSG